MRMLDELLQGVEVRSLVGDGTVAVGRLEFDSRKVVPGTLFSLRGARRPTGMPIFLPRSQPGRRPWCARSCPPNGPPG